MDDFITNYISYMRDTEPPYVYHRWSAIASIGALLGRSYYLQHGHFRIFPNLYTILIGDPASRKSTAIKLARKLLSPAGYKTFASTKTSKEQFLHDLEASSEEGFGLQDTGEKNGKAVLDRVTERELWGSSAINDAKEVFVVADEFSEFSGVGNAEFYTTLGNLWDWDDPGDCFTQRLKNSKSVSIYQPTVSILGGTTPSKFAKIFPPEIMDDGFLSRLLIIHGERSERKYPFPPEPSRTETDVIVSWFTSVRQRDYGCAQLDDDAKKILEEIYHNWGGLTDARFKSYNSRRYTQLLKLSLISSVSRGVAPVITGYNIIEANTWLAAAETKMPLAVGEFGKSKNSDIANKIMEVLLVAKRPLGAGDIWKQVHKDLEKLSMLADIMNGLQIAGKVQIVKGAGGGWLPVREQSKKVDFVDWELLTKEEQVA